MCRYYAYNYERGPRSFYFVYRERVLREVSLLKNFRWPREELHFRGGFLLSLRQRFLSLFFEDKQHLLRFLKRYKPSTLLERFR
jgi:hypothetical protein